MLRIRFVLIFLVISNNLFRLNNLFCETIGIFTKQNFILSLKSYPYTLVHFYNNKSSLNSKSWKQSISAIKQASEFDQFIKAGIGFVSVNLDNNDLNLVYKNYDYKKPINLCVIYENKIPYRVNNKTTKLEFKDTTNEKTIRKFIVASIQNKIDQIIDKKYPINSANLKALLSNIKIKAFLDTIAYCEGAFKPDGYRLKYMGEYFESFHDHPRTVSCGVINGNKFCSTAAGRYQFLEKTWDSLAPLIGAKNFGPINQDIAALVLLHRAGALDDLKTGHFENAVKKVGHIWSSLPGSPYGQEQKSMHIGHLKQVYNKRLAALK